MGFKSVLKKIGEDFLKGLSFVMPWAQTVGAAAVSLAAPQLSPMYNTTVAAVSLAEQKYSALGKQNGSGPQKLADVVGIAGPVIAAGLNDAGKPNAAKDVENYINSVVAILNTTPAN